jgi:hypothetical protein
MLRTVAVLVLLVFGAFFTGIYAAYGEFDPCRALAVENARRSALPTPLARTWYAMTGERKNPFTCSRALIGSWHDRLTS